MPTSRTLTFPRDDLNMTNYIVIENCWKGGDMTAGSKARTDVEHILLNSGFAPLTVNKSVPLDVDHHGLFSKIFGRL